MSEHLAFLEQTTYSLSLRALMILSSHCFHVRFGCLACLLCCARFCLTASTTCPDARPVLECRPLVTRIRRSALPLQGGQLSGSGMASLGQLLPPASTARAVADAQGPPGVQTRAALNFMLSKDGEFFREFILDEVRPAAVSCPDPDVFRRHWIFNCQSL